MDEIHFIGQRIVKTVHETDRTSSDLLAKAFQQLNAEQRRHTSDRGSVQSGPAMKGQTHSLQEVQG